MKQVPPVGELIEMLAGARRRTFELVSDLDDTQLMGPRLDIVNPLLWEIGHLAWFQERWALRHLRDQPPILEQGDALYDSAAVAHDSRWDLPLPTRQGTLDYMEQVFGQVVERLGPDTERQPEPEELYFHLLPLFHEDMHDEAFAYTRQTLRYPPPLYAVRSAGTPAGPASRSSDVEIPGERFLLGAARDVLFVFDNEKWEHEVQVPPFVMAATAVSQGEFLSFVEDDGYRRQDLWSPDGWKWCHDERAVQPLYWEREESGLWQRRSFDRVVPLQPDLPMIHVSWFEAEAYCRWAGRRLPTEAEWELAASTPGKRSYPWGDESPSPVRANLDGAAGGVLPVNALPAGDSAHGCRQMLGNVWEWTATTFEPYPGFTVDPYKEYSQPWFGTQKVLRGGCWTTASRLIRNTWRNFYTPDRRDVWAGFRTCAA